MTPATPLVHNPRFEGHTLRADLSGILTVNNAPEALKEFDVLIHAQKPTEIILDLSGALHLDSGGLAVLVHVRRSLGPDGKMSLVGLKPDLFRLLQIMRLSAIFHCEMAVPTAAGIPGVPGVPGGCPVSHVPSPVSKPAEPQASTPKPQASSPKPLDVSGGETLTDDAPPT